MGAPRGQCPVCLLSLATSLGLPSEADEALLNAGQVREFGDYQLIEEIARGGMGVVYHAMQMSTGREVAVKMILAGQLATPEAVARFHNEAAAAAKLEHPNIIPVFEIGEFQTQHFFTMSFVPGRRNIATWARTLPAERRFQVLAVTMARVARAIAFAHERGVLHRDLKPSNILMNEADEPQVTDFGLAKLLDSDAPTLTLSSAMLGSPSYMAPEQAEPRGREITTATDVYGLGAILYELLSGRPPFTGASPIIVARKVVDEAPRRLVGVPEDLDTLCRKCLAKFPHDRYATAAALAEDLDRFVLGQPVLAMPESTFSLVATWARQKPIAASLAGALMLTLVIGLIGALSLWYRAEAARVATATANSQLRGTIDHLEWRQIDILLDRDHAPRAVTDLAARLREDPQSWQAASYAISILEQRPFAFPLGPAVVIPEGELTGLAVFSPEGTRAAYATAGKRVRVLDTISAQDAFPPLEAGDEVARLAFSPDGRLLAAGCDGGSVVLWKMPGGEFLSRTATPLAPLRDCVFSTDSHVLAIAGGDSVASSAAEGWLAGQPPTRVLAAGFSTGHVRCSADGKRLFTWGVKAKQPFAAWGPLGSEGAFTSPADGEVRGAALDASGRRAAVITGQFEVQVWDLEQQRLLRTIPSELSPITHLILTPDGERVVLCFQVGAARVYSTVAGLPASQPMPQLYQLSSVALDSTGSVLLTGGWDFKARVWDAWTGNPLSEAIPHRGSIQQSMLSAAGDRALTLAEEPGTKVRYLQAWQIRPPLAPATFQPPGGRSLDAFRLSPDDRLLAVGAYTPNNNISVFDVASGRPVLDRAPINGGAYALEFTPDQRRFFVVTNAGWLHGWSMDPATAWQPLWPAVKLPSGLQPAAFSPDGRLMAAGCTDGVVRLYETESGTLVREMKHGALIKGLRFDPSGTRVVSSARDNLTQIWKVDTGEKLATLRGHTAAVLGAEFSPDGTRIVTFSYDCTARLWNAATGAELCAPLFHGGEVSHATFSPDGRRIATASRDGTARLWDGFNGTPLIEPISRPDTVQTVQFHPDGRRFLTIDQAGFRLWDAQTGEAVTLQYAYPLSSGLGLDSPTDRDSFSHDGRQIVQGLARNSATLWPIPDPPAPVPAWFPDFLDAVATGGINLEASDRTIPGTRLLEWKERARHFGNTDFYEKWVRRYLELPTLP